MNHPENDGSKIITPHSQDVLNAAEKQLKQAKLKYLISLLGKGAIYCVATYGGVTTFTPGIDQQNRNQKKIS